MFCKVGWKSTCLVSALGEVYQLTSVAMCSSHGEFCVSVFMISVDTVDFGQFLKERVTFRGVEQCHYRSLVCLICMLRVRIPRKDETHLLISFLGIMP